MRTARSLPHLIAAGSLVAAGLTGVGVATGASQASAAQACESWSSTLRPGSTGSGVKELQIRVAGWVPSGQVMGADGIYGDQTKAAVARFQKAYGLADDGIAGSQTFAKLRSLTKSDCTPLNFTYAEASNNCGKGFTGSASVKENLRRSLWQAQALRRQLGDKPLPVSSGFRDSACNSASGGASSSQHLTGKALDFTPPSGVSMCALARQARSAGYGGIFGPGYPGHSNHVHGDWRTTKAWSASQCF